MSNAPNEMPPIMDMKVRPDSVFIYLPFKCPSVQPPSLSARIFFRFQREFDVFFVSIGPCEFLSILI